MYEQALRYCREVPGRVSLQKQVDAYLAAMNAMKLLPPLDSWIVRPRYVSVQEKKAFFLFFSFSDRRENFLKL